MKEGKTNLVVTLDTELHHNLKVYCAEQRITIKQLIIESILEKIDNKQEEHRKEVS